MDIFKLEISILLYFISFKNIYINYINYIIFRIFLEIILFYNYNSFEKEIAIIYC